MNKEHYISAMNDIKPDARLIEKTKMAMAASQEKLTYGKKVVKSLMATPLRYAMVSMVLVFTLIGIYYWANRSVSMIDVDAQALNITALSQKDGTVAVDSKFKIEYSGKEKLATADLIRCIKLEPTMEFALDKQAENTFVLSPKGELASDSIVNLVLTNGDAKVQKSWAFQTQTVFKVIATTPADLSRYVDTTTGIEVTFSYPVSEEQFKSSLTISPETTGTVKTNGKTLVFVPDKELKTSTIYTVTISGSLVTTGGTTLGKDYSFSFRTADNSGKAGGYNLENYSSVTESFLAGDAPVIAVNASAVFKMNDTPLKVSVYKFRSAVDYEKELAAYAQKKNVKFGDYEMPQIDTSRLDKLSDFETKLTVSAQSFWAPSYIILPDGLLNEGWYYIEVTTTNPSDGKEIKLYKLMQISSISAYYMQADAQTLFWVHDTQSQKAIEGAQVKLNGEKFSAEGNTGADGAAILRTSVDEKSLERNGVMTITKGEKTYVDLYTAQSETTSSMQEKYVSYLYLDRPIYLSTDTIKAWGMVRPRGNAGKPEKLRLQLSSYDSELYSVPVTLSPDGTFTAELSFAKMSTALSGGWEQVRLVCGENEDIASAGISISDYVKPTYTTSTGTDRPVYRVGETVASYFKQTFFDETPASNSHVQLNFEDSSVASPQSQELTTGADGKATASVKLIGSQNTWRPYTLSYTIRNTSPENENFQLYGSVPVVYRDLALRGNMGDDGNLSIRTNRVDISKIVKAEDLNQEDNLIGATWDTAVTAELHRVYFTKKETGSYYDFIHKLNVPTYEYEHHDDIESSKTIQTKNGEYTLTDLPKSSKDAYYYFLLKAADSKGATVEETAYLSLPYDYGYSTSKHRYNFIKKGVGNDYAAMYKFDEGEKVAFEVRDNGAPVSEGRILSAIVQKEITRYQTSGKPEAEVAYEESLVPNYTIAGAYFDGKYVYEINPYWMSFNPQKRKLNIKVTTDQEKYAPGAKAKLLVNVTYQDSGKPAANTPVLVSLVDEAVFAIQDVTADPLSALYSSAYSANLNFYTSYHQYDLIGYGGAEKGGGGGDEGVRSDFKDTAAFVTATTDSSGKANLEVQLPDNITSWRATTQAITENLCAGADETNIIVTGRFFISGLVSDQLIDGDDATLSLRSFGTAINPSDMVDYTIEIKGGTESQKITASGAAKSYTVAKIPALPKGSYTLTMSAKCGDLLDAIEQPLKVLDSGIEVSLSKTFDLANGINIEPERFPVMLGLYNQSYKFYSQVLDSLNAAIGNRADERIARRFASETLSQLSGKALILPAITDELADVMNTQGQVFLYRYDSPNTAVTAKVHLATPEYLFGADTLKAFEDIMKDESSAPKEVAAAYLGLAAHKKPVLTEIRSLLENSKGLELEHKLTLVAALAALGDDNGANSYYQKLVAPVLSSGKDAFGDLELHVEAGADSDENSKLTALASITASLTKNKDATSLVRYLINHPAKKDIYLLEQILYLKNFTPETGTDASVRYTLNGQTNELALEKLGVKFISLSAEQFEKANFSVTKGSVWTTAYYIGGADEASQQDFKEIKLSKTYTKNGAISTQFKAGDVVAITITPSADSTVNPNNMIINDYIPSGMRYIGMGSNQNASNGGWSLQVREGQRVSFVYYNWQFSDSGYDKIPGGNGQSTGGAVKPLTFYVRCATSGDYITESAFARAAQTPAWGMTDRSRIVIGPQ